MTESEKKRNTVIFTIITAALNVVLTLLIILALFTLCVILFYKVLNFQTSIAIQIAMPILLIGSLIIDFFISIRLIRIAIIKFGLEDKINAKVANKYLHGKQRHADTDNQ